MHTAQRLLIATALGAFSVDVSAKDVGIVLMTMEWDPRQPRAGTYQENPQDRMINDAAQQVWSQNRDAITALTVAAVSQPDKIRPGVTLYDVKLEWSSAEMAPSLEASAGGGGTIRFFLPGNSMEFKSTYPGIPRALDPRMEVTFDLQVDIPFRFNERRNPPLEIVAARSQAVNARVRALNFSAGVGLTVDDVVTAFTGGDRLRDAISEGFASGGVNLTNTMRSYLARNAALLGVPPGYQFNGGVVQNDRIYVSAWKRKELPVGWITATAHWSEEGYLIPNCESLGFVVTLPAAPPPLGGKDFVTYPARPQGASPAQSTGQGMRCTARIQTYQGVGGPVSYREVVAGSSPSNNPGMTWKVLAIPEQLPDPIVAGDGTGLGAAIFRLEKQQGLQDGVRQLDVGQAALQSPLDPVAAGAPRADDRLRTPAVTAPAPQVPVTPSPASVGTPPVLMPPTRAVVPATQAPSAGSAAAPVAPVTRSPIGVQGAAPPSTLRNPSAASQQPKAPEARPRR